MYMHELAMDAFVLVHAHWTVAQARRVIRRLRPTHVIVHRAEPQDNYYLYTRYDMLVGLAQQPDTIRVRDALDFHEHDATATDDAYACSSGKPGRNLVVVNEGRLVGFFDATISPADRERRRLRQHGSRPEASVPRSLVTEFPEQVRLGDTASLLAWLASKTGAGAALTAALPVGTTVDIIVQPKRGLALEGAAEQEVEISSAEETLPAQFKLKATGVGRGRVRVLAFHKGQAVGDITIAPAVVPVAELVDAARHRSRRCPEGPPPWQQAQRVQGVR